jgi:ubiquinone/menaquinone biosynthesis C-methylase UbiE
MAVDEDGHNYFFGGWRKEMPWKTKRNFKHIDNYLTELEDDIYPQPPDAEHTKQAKYVIDNWVDDLDVESVLDIGCGEAFCQPFFEEYDLEYLGVCLGEDYEIAKEQDRTVIKEDFHFLSLKDESWDLSFVRHSLEHSPMPLLALMEWHRVTRDYLILILPKPRFWLFIGRNHYSVVTGSQARFLLDRVGWQIIEEDNEHEWEYRFLCEKKERVFNPDEGYLWAYEHENLDWLDMAEPPKEEFEFEEVEEEVVSV